MGQESWASSEAVRRVMQANRARDTAPEWAVRRAVHALGLRYRVSMRPEPTIRRTADLVFTRARVAVFVDGCFWHGCPQHRTHPRTNATYWAEKIEGNIARDLDTTARLEAAGWTVLRYWQHEDPLTVASAIATEVRRPGTERPPVTPEWPHAPVRGGGAASRGDRGPRRLSRAAPGGRARPAVDHS